jgi:hypothetical protein
MIKLYKIYSKDDPQKLLRNNNTEPPTLLWKNHAMGFDSFKNNEKPSAIAANLLQSMERRDAP